MIVAVVMKFAGNILRNFSQALAIIVGGFGSWLLFDFRITSQFVVGVALVIASIFIYGSKAEQIGTLCAAFGGSKRPAGAEYTALKGASADAEHDVEESAPLLSRNVDDSSDGRGTSE